MHMRHQTEAVVVSIGAGLSLFTGVLGGMRARACVCLCVCVWRHCLCLAMHLRHQIGCRGGVDGLPSHKACMGCCHVRDLNS